ncbi:MAG: hypothetical protein HQ559_13145 [Lentisphaerae bacterium]|nr:hypothetical protein [Lentisphaerota bacterium]
MVHETRAGRVRDVRLGIKTWNNGTSAGEGRDPVDGIRRFRQTLAYLLGQCDAVEEEVYSDFYIPTGKVYIE